MSTIHQIQAFLADSGKVLGFLILLIILIKNKKIDNPISVIGFYVGVNLLISLIAGQMWLAGKNNLPLLHLNTLLEFLCFSIFYKQLFWDQKWFQSKFWIVIVGITLLLIGNSIYLEPIDGFNSNAKTIVQLVLIFYAICYFFISYGKTDFSVVKNQALLFINFAVVLYYSGSLFIFMFTKYLINNNASEDFQAGFWLFNAVLNIVFQFLILISIWKVAFSKTKSLS